MSERIHFVKDNGTVAEREQYLQLQRKLRAVYRAAGEGFNDVLQTEFGDQGWQSFQSAITIRDRLTHPKTFQDCHVSEDDLDMIDAAEAWYRGLNNEFVRVARKHRESGQW